MFEIFGWMGGTGKPRSKFGRWIDREGITQLEIEAKSGLSRGTISRICNDPDYRPKFETVMKVKKALKSLGCKLPPDNYFGL